MDRAIFEKLVKTAAKLAHEAHKNMRGGRGDLVDDVFAAIAAAEREFARVEFTAGEWVTWRDEPHATMTEGRKRFGDGPFLIVKTIDTAGVGAAGHGQWVDVVGPSMPEHRFSGAFFKHFDEAEGRL